MNSEMWNVSTEEKKLIDLPSSLFLQFGAEQQVGKEEDMSKFPCPFYYLHHKLVSEKLPIL